MAGLFLKHYISHLGLSQQSTTVWLHQQKYIFSQFWRLEVQNQGVHGPCSLKSLGRILPFPFLASWCMHAKSLQSCPTLCNPLDCSLPGFSVQGIHQREYWDGLPCPPLGNRPNPGIEPVSFMSSALPGEFFIPKATWEALGTHYKGYTHGRSKRKEQWAV